MTNRLILTETIRNLLVKTGAATASPIAEVLDATTREPYASVFTLTSPMGNYRITIEDARPLTPEPTPAPGKRMTLSQIVELLLTRGAHDRSSVSLSRNAKGETQIEVTVRTGEGSECATVKGAEVVAREVYDTLRARYPLATGYAGAIPETTKKKGDGNL